MPLCPHCHQRHREDARCVVYDSTASSLGNPPDPALKGGRVEPAPRPDQRRPVVKAARGALSGSWGLVARRREVRP